MTRSPATPHKTGQHAAKTSPQSGMPSAEKLTTLAKLQQAQQEPLHEPSPASTYGGTAGSSVPATPQGMEQTGFDQGMLNKLNISATASPSESIYGSPGGTRNGHESSTHSGQYAGAAILVSHTRPTNSRNFGGIVVPCKPSSDASPNRLEFINEISNWRPVSDGSNGDFQRGVTFRAGNFVHPAGNEADDVFGTSRDGETQGQGKLDSCILLIIALTVKGDDSNRPDGTGEAISNDNAQALLPPSACVFVANLTQTQSDDQLEHHVQIAFSQFGTCYVKIRRDSNGMPFAFVQYETVEDAQRAITQGRGMHINNRPCRTEVAKVNRSLYLSRVTGGYISEAEAREVLSRYGEIEKVWYSSPTESEIFRLPEGIWVMYKLFQPCRDAQSGFRGNSHYRLEQPPMADDFRARLRTRQYQSMSPLRARQSHGHVIPSPMRRTTTTDLRSIFVGNLPASINEEELFHMFEPYGPIQHIEIVRKPSANPAGINTFAFIEYMIPEGAAAAVQASPRIYGNVRLRVERKESADPSGRLNTYMTSSGSPRSQYMGDPHDQMAMQFQRGLYAGLSQAAQVQTAPPPMWAGYPYYQQYDPSQYGHFTGAPVVQSDTATASSLQAHAHGYAAQTVAQAQFPQTPTQYVPYQPQLSRTSYQWPPAVSPSDAVNDAPNMNVQETH